MPEVISIVLCHGEKNKVQTCYKADPEGSISNVWMIGVLKKTPITQVIFFNQGVLLLGPNHFLRKYNNFQMILPDFRARFLLLLAQQVMTSESIVNWF